MHISTPLVSIRRATHLQVNWVLSLCDIMHAVQVSIAWRGNALGFTQSHQSERSSEQQGHYLDHIAVLLAGRAAEDVCCGTISSGSYGDLKVVCATII
jgi:ATP-dependent Zn protease